MEKKKNTDEILDIINQRLVIWKGELQLRNLPLLKGIAMPVIIQKIADDAEDLQELEARNSGLTDEELLLLASALETNTHLTVLNINENKLSNDSITKFFQLILQLNNSGLTKIHYQDGNYFRNETLAAEIQAFTKANADRNRVDHARTLPVPPVAPEPSPEQPRQTLRGKLEFERTAIRKRKSQSRFANSPLKIDSTPVHLNPASNKFSPQPPVKPPAAPPVTLATLSISEPDNSPAVLVTETEVDGSPSPATTLPTTTTTSEVEPPGEKFSPSVSEESSTELPSIPDQLHLKYEGAQLSLSNLQFTDVIVHNSPVMVLKAYWQPPNNVGPKKELAVKLVSLHACSHNQSLFKKYRDGLEREATLHHLLDKYIVDPDHIVKYFGFLEETLTYDCTIGEELKLLRGDKLVGIATKYIRGFTLKDFICSELNHTLSDIEKIRILRDISSCLAAIHGQGVCHGDVKPANILLTDKTYIPIFCDFGKSRVLEMMELNRSTLEIGEDAAGTYGYMAPEIQLMKAKPSRSTDIYSFGLIIWELLTNEPGSTKNDYIKQHPEDSQGRLPPILFEMIKATANDNRELRGYMLEHYQDLDAYYKRKDAGRYDIFFSHGWENKPFLSHIYSYFCDLNYLVWYDLSNMSLDMKQSMTQGIENSTITIACINGNYFTKPFCRFELKLAYDKKKPIIFILLEDPQEIIKKIDETPEAQEFKQIVDLSNFLFVHVGAKFKQYNWKEINKLPNTHKKKAKAIKDLIDDLKNNTALFNLLQEQGIRPQVQAKK